MDPIFWKIEWDLIEFFFAKLFVDSSSWGHENDGALWINSKFQINSQMANNLILKLSFMVAYSVFPLWMCFYLLLVHCFYCVLRNSDSSVCFLQPSTFCFSINEILTLIPNRRIRSNSKFKRCQCCHTFSFDKIDMKDIHHLIRSTHRLNVNLSQYGKSHSLYHYARNRCNALQFVLEFRLSE